MADHPKGFIGIPSLSGTIPVIVTRGRAESGCGNMINMLNVSDQTRLPRAAAQNADAAKAQIRPIPDPSS
jgi:hypothetical protein